ncbi:MAG: NAD(P)-dependent oxidoreductase [Deltaproteobacteria bacterium]|nr:NAD(P)-dependent oxidoreductase [Deltaproteobacteria bacterium]
MSNSILVTGSEGFIGRALCRRLQAEEFEVHRFSRSLGHQILSEEAFRPFYDKPIGQVVHLAGESFIPTSWETPGPFYAMNTLGTQRVLDFCRRMGSRLIYFSSFVYGAPKYLPIDEEHPIAPLNPYTHSRWLAEELCEFYSQRFSVDSAILRPFNIYGPGQDERFLISQCVGQWKRGERVQVKSLTPRRDYLYLDDLVEATLLVIRNRELSGVFNIGSGQSYSVQEILTTLQELIGPTFTFECVNQERIDEVPETRSSSRLQTTGLWNPRVSLREGLTRILREGAIL